MSATPPSSSPAPSARTPAEPFDIVLAPMEGVVDAPMRARLTALGGYDRCVTEFLRVSDALLPERVFRRLCPELATGGRTPAGVPVHLQLLGSDGPLLAANACRAAALGAPGIDLNFGCPAKTVNRSSGGAILLREPARVARLVAAVREALPPAIPLGVKVRLGYDDGSRFVELVAGIRAAGADRLVVHARTKRDGYRPPARWSEVRPAIPEAGWATINGEIWSVADALAARAESGCRHLMLGRGALAVPDLARRIRAGEGASPAASWPEILALVEAEFHAVDSRSPRHVGNRTKQWLGFLGRTYPEARTLFARLRRLHEARAIAAAFAAHRDADLPPAGASAEFRSRRPRVIGRHAR